MDLLALSPSLSQDQVAALLLYRCDFDGTAVEKDSAVNHLTAPEIDQSTTSAATTATRQHPERSLVSRHI